MARWLKSVATILAVAGLSALLVWAFREGRKEMMMERERERPIKVPSRVLMQDGESVITLDQETQRKSDIVVAPLTSVSHQEEIRAYGVVLPSQDFVDLRNTYAAAKAQVEKTQASLAASRKEYERLKGLHTANQNISDKALQAVEATWRSDEASARAAQEALQTVERTARLRWGGVLAEWLSDTSQLLERLMRQQEVLIQVTLPAGVQLLAAPQTARVQAADSTLVSAKLVSPSPRTDPRIQGVSFFYLAPAQTLGFLVGMNVLAYLPVGSQVQGVLVPASAIVWWQGRVWIYVQKDLTHFVRREIPTETPVQEGWFVGKAFAAGDRVVVSGAQLLLSEEFRAQIQVGEEGKSQ